MHFGLQNWVCYQIMYTVLYIGMQITTHVRPPPRMQLLYHYEQNAKTSKQLSFKLVLLFSPNPPVLPINHEWPWPIWRDRIRVCFLLPLILDVLFRWNNIFYMLMNYYFLTNELCKDYINLLFKFLRFKLYCIVVLHCFAWWKVSFYDCAS